MKRIGGGGPGVLLCLTVTACVTTNAVQLNPTSPKCPAISPAKVRIFGSQQELDNLKVPYITVAQITVSASDLASADKVIESVKEKAAEIGANGVILAQGAGSNTDLAVQYGSCTAPAEGNK
jgi:lipopolysaccharide export system protein LptA